MIKKIYYFVVYALISMIGIFFALNALRKGDIWGGGPGHDHRNNFILYGSIMWTLTIGLIIWCN